MLQEPRNSSVGGWSRASSEGLSGLRICFQDSWLTWLLMVGLSSLWLLAKGMSFLLPRFWDHWDYLGGYNGIKMNKWCVLIGCMMENQTCDFLQGPSSESNCAVEQYYQLSKHQVTGKSLWSLLGYPKRRCLKAQCPLEKSTSSSFWTNFIQIQVHWD